MSEDVRILHNLLLLLGKVTATGRECVIWVEAEAYVRKEIERIQKDSLAAAIEDGVKATLDALSKDNGD